MFEYIRIRSFLPHDGVPDKFKRLCFTPPCVIYNHAGGTLITTNRMFDISKGVCSDIRRKNQKRKWSKFPTPISRAASRRISALCMSAVAVCILISVMVISCWCSSRTPGNHSGEIGVISYGDDEMIIKRINYVQSEDWLELVPLKPVLPAQTDRGHRPGKMPYYRYPARTDTRVLNIKITPTGCSR